MQQTQRERLIEELGRQRGFWSSPEIDDSGNLGNGLLLTRGRALMLESWMEVAKEDRFGQDSEIPHKIEQTRARVNRLWEAYYDRLCTLG